MLSRELIQRFYFDTTLTIPKFWNPSRKHFRVETSEGRFVKLNKLENRLTARDVAFYCSKARSLLMQASSEWRSDGRICLFMLCGGSMEKASIGIARLGYRKSAKTLLHS